jgi:hypothetical protein
MCSECCKEIRYKRYLLPLVFVPLAAIHPDVFNFYYLPLVVGFSAFILFWNFPKMVYYTTSRPLYYEDLFIDEKKLPNYDVTEGLKIKFQCILEWVLIITNTLLVAGLSDWWLYKTTDHFNIMEIVGITGGIIKIFQIVNNTISRILLQILRNIIKKENREIRNKQSIKIIELAKFKIKEDPFPIYGENVILEPKRVRLQTI